MKKNDVVKVTIEDIGINGEGIGKIQNYPLFVKGGIPGDEILARITKTKKTYGYGRVEEILHPSPDRIEPPCPIAEPCGGCQLQALSYEKQLTFKEKTVKGNLERIGKVPSPLLEKVMNPIVGMEEPFRYRNKAAYPIGRNRDGRIVAGFYAGRTHQIIPVDDCLLGKKENKTILNKIISHVEKHQIEPYDEVGHRGLIRHVLIRYGEKTGEWMVSIVINGNTIPKKEELIEALVEIQGMTSISLSVNKKNTNVIMGNEIITIWGQEYITDKIGDLSFQISPLAFYQVNQKQTEKLYNLALTYADLKGKEKVWDLYCGIGTISLFLAQKAEMVYGVEVVPEAIENAKENAKINGLANARFYVGKAEEVLPAHIKEHGRAEVIVVDPPRKGCAESLLETMVNMEPERIVYVSCDSATLARDVKYLRENGYELREVTPVDQFGMTVHVECVCLMTRKET